METMSQLRDWVEIPIINVMQLYTEYVKEGSISQERAKWLIEEYGALICFLDNSIIDQKVKKMITTYRRDLINLAKNTIDAIGEKEEQEKWKQEKLKSQT